MLSGIIGLLGSAERGRQIERWVEEIINDIKEVEGVKGVFLLNSQGKLLYPLSPADHALTKPIVEASADIIQALAIFEITGNPVHELKLNFSEGVLLVYDRLGLGMKTAQGFEETCLVIPCTRNVNRPHLRMVMKVAMTKAQDHRKNGHQQPGYTKNKQASLTRTKLEPSLHKLLDAVSGSKNP